MAPVARSLRVTRFAMAMPAQLTTIRSAPSWPREAASAASTLASLVTSHL
jgi:hypothetical protein